MEYEESTKAEDRRTNVYKNLSLEKLIALEKGDKRLGKGEHRQGRGGEKEAAYTH